MNETNTPLSDLQMMALAVLREGAAAAQPFLDALAEKLQQPERLELGAVNRAELRRVITVPYERLRVVLEAHPGRVDSLGDPDHVGNAVRAWLENGTPLVLTGCTVKLFEVPEGWSEQVKAHHERLREDEERRYQESINNEEPLLPPKVNDADFLRPRGLPLPVLSDAEREEAMRNRANLAMDVMGPDPNPVHRPERIVAVFEDVDPVSGRRVLRPVEVDPDDVDLSEV